MSRIIRIWTCSLISTWINRFRSLSCSQVQILKNVQRLEFTFQTLELRSLLLFYEILSLPRKNAFIISTRPFWRHNFQNLYSSLSPIMTYFWGIPYWKSTFSVLEQVSGFVPTSLFNKCRETLETFNFQLLRGYG